jgi:hypothetical protein
LNHLKVTISSFQEILSVVFRSKQQMKFFTKLARKFSAVALNVAFPSKRCVQPLVAAIHAGYISSTTTHHQRCNVLTHVQTRAIALEIHWHCQTDCSSQAGYVCIMRLACPRDN